MAQPKRLNVCLSPEAILDIDQITSWNVANNGFEQAVKYREFLITSISQLEESYNGCRKVARRPDLKFIVLRWSPKGHGHIVVFVVDEQSEKINVARIYHTSQNWESYVRRDL